MIVNSWNQGLPPNDGTYFVYAPSLSQKAILASFLNGNWYDKDPYIPNNINEHVKMYFLISEPPEPPKLTDRWINENLLDF